jgi:hypothetical protein
LLFLTGLTGLPHAQVGAAIDHGHRMVEVLSALLERKLAGLSAGFGGQATAVSG